MLERAYGFKSRGRTNSSATNHWRLSIEPSDVGSSTRAVERSHVAPPVPQTQFGSSDQQSRRIETGDPALTMLQSFELPTP